MFPAVIRSAAFTRFVVFFNHFMFKSGEEHLPTQTAHLFFVMVFSKHHQLLISYTHLILSALRLTVMVTDELPGFSALE